MPKQILALNPEDRKEDLRATPFHKFLERSTGHKMLDNNNFEDAVIGYYHGVDFMAFGFAEQDAKILMAIYNRFWLDVMDDVQYQPYDM